MAVNVLGQTGLYRFASLVNGNDMRGVMRSRDNVLPLFWSGIRPLTHDSKLKRVRGSNIVVVWKIHEGASFYLLRHRRSNGNERECVSLMPTSIAGA
jgi:hypothetical protein